MIMPEHCQSMKILVFIPAYNCENQIGRVLERLSQFGDYFEEVIVVDNQSSDQTQIRAKECIARLGLDRASILLNDNNYGLGGSHKVAFSYARENGFDYVIVLHGDDQADFADIVPQIKNGTLQSADCLLGSRFSKGSVLAGYSKFRVYGNYILNWFCSFFTGFQIKDMGSGLNAYKLSSLERSNVMNFPENLTFNVYFLFEHKHDRLRFVFFPISWKEVDQLSNAKFISQSFEILKLTMRYFKRSAVIKEIKGEGKEYTYRHIS